MDVVYPFLFENKPMPPLRFTLNKSKDQLCNFTLLSFISERKACNYYPPRCVVRQSMAMICGPKTMYRVQLRSVIKAYCCVTTFQLVNYTT